MARLLQTLSSCRTEYFGRLGMVKVSFGSNSEKSLRAIGRSASLSGTDIICRTCEVRKLHILLRKSAATDGSVGHFAKDDRL